MSKFVTLMTLLIVFSATEAYAVKCTEKVTNVISHSNGGVYFQTDSTCEGWCQLVWGSNENINRGYSLLLTAKTTNSNVVFHWSGIPDCSSMNGDSASPDYMRLK